MTISWPGVALVGVVAVVVLAMQDFRDDATGCGCATPARDNPGQPDIDARDWRGVPTDRGTGQAIPQNPNDYELPWSIYSGPLYRNVPSLTGLGSPIPSNPNDWEPSWSVFQSGLYRN